MQLFHPGLFFDRTVRVNVVDASGAHPLPFSPERFDYGKNDFAARIPRDIVRLFVCTYNGAEVFRAELHPAIAANPFIVFSTVATGAPSLNRPKPLRSVSTMYWSAMMRVRCVCSTR